MDVFLSRLAISSSEKPSESDTLLSVDSKSYDFSNRISDFSLISIHCASGLRDSSYVSKQ